MTNTPYGPGVTGDDSEPVATGKYRVNWDNGANDCGTFEMIFDTEEAAQAFADDWMFERNYEDRGLTPEQVEECGGEDCYTAEVIEADEEATR